LSALTIEKLVGADGRIPSRGFAKKNLEGKVIQKTTTGKRQAPGSQPQ